jgi:uncharacterized membrane protein
MATSEDRSTPPPAGLRSPQALLDGVLLVEESAALDGAAARLDGVAAAVARPGTAHDLLAGVWLGHAVHPLMTDLPIGFWTSASVLDLVGGRRARPAADLLLAAGTLAALPTVATGLAEYQHADTAARRVGVVHVAANTVGVALYAASLAARVRGRRARGVVLALAGATAATVGGYLGGHLATARKVGTRDPAFNGSPRPAAPPVPRPTDSGSVPPRPSALPEPGDGSGRQPVP